ncbi:MAG: sulfotransferase domain-containing protein [Pirellulales bacterium]
MSRNHLLTRLWHSQGVRGARHLASPRLWFRYLTASRRSLPQFIIAGAQKAGTTSLYGYLAGHPQCRAPWTKEVNFYDQNFARGERWYRMHFPLSTGAVNRPHFGGAGALCFEASPHYMFEPEVPTRMRESLPEVKAIFLLRDPIRRAYSHYQHEVRRRRISIPFEDCIDAEIRQRAGERPPAPGSEALGLPSRPLTLLARGLYVDQLQRWEAHFPADRMLVLEAERLFRAPADTFAQVLAFLGLDAWAPAAFGNLNPGRYSTPMSSVARERAERFFEPHNERLFQHLNTRYAWK